MTRLTALLLTLLLLPLCAPAQSAAEGECRRLRSDMARAFDAKDFAQAVTVGTALFARCPLSAEDWDPLSAQLAAALRDSGRDSDALAVVERCIARQPRSPDCLLEKALLLRKLGRPAAAQQALQAARRFGATGAERTASRPDEAADAGSPGQERRRAGSGFFINHDGDIVTNAHVVAGCNRIETSGKLSLKLSGLDAAIDLAVLRADRAPDAIVALRGAPPPRVGEDVLAFGFPLPGLLSTEGNVTVGILSATRGVADDPHVFQMTAPVQSGNSGGPLIDASGNVVGVVVAKLDAARVSQRTGDMPQNVNFAIKASELAAFLDRRHIAYSLGQLGARKNPADLAEAAQKYAVQILCFGF